MIMYSLIFLLFAVFIIGIGLGLTFWIVHFKKRNAVLSQKTPPNAAASSPKSIEADFVEFAVSQKDINNLENKSGEFGAFLLNETIYQGKIINFSGMNLKINQIKQENANTITAKTEISIVPIDETFAVPGAPTPGAPAPAEEAALVSEAKAQPSAPACPKKNVLMILTSIISFILIATSFFYVVSGFLKSDFVKKASSFFGKKKHQTESYTKEKKSEAKENYAASQTPRLSDKDLAELMYPGKIVSNFTISDMSQESITQYIGYPGFYIKTKSFSDFATGSARSMNTIVIAAKEYADLTGDDSDELIVVSIGDDKILPDCMANLSANNVVVYKWNGSNYEELWRTNMDLGQEGKFDKLEIAGGENIPVIRLYGTRFTHGNSAPFVDSYKWNGETFIPESN